MKKIKMYLSVAVFAMVGVVGYSTYTNATMSEAERLMIENVEALTNGESSGMLNGPQKNMAVLDGLRVKDIDVRQN